MSEITLLEYFMAHAPTEPQPWFEPVMPPQPKRPSRFKELDEEDRQKFDQELPDYAPEECSAALLEFCERDSVARYAQERWKKDRARQRYLQWPLAWATAQVQLRAGIDPQELEPPV